MQDDEKKEIERILQDGLDALTAALRGIDEESVRLRPRPDSWSVLDCLEHIALTEAALLPRLHEAKPSDRSHADPARETRFRELALNRQRPIVAPDPVCPGRESPTLSHACQAFHAVRDQTLCFLRNFKGDLRSWLAIHPLITRPVNCYEMLLLIALHPTRHAQQIAEIREQIRRSRGQMQ